MNGKIIIRVPASTSNLGSGFDTIGLALDLYNTFTFAPCPTGLRITFAGHGARQLETGVDNRTYRSFATVFQSFGLDVPPVEIHHHNEIPIARGLGGSATAVLAGIMAAFAFLDKQPSVDEVLSHATKIENHPDNLTPSLVGGLTVSTMEPGRIIFLRIPVPAQLTSVVYFPDLAIPTGRARQVLPKEVSFDDAVFNLRAVAMFVAAVGTGSFEKLHIGMQDRLHQPYRAALLPGMYSVFEAATLAGARGVALSGAGSGIFALVDHDANRVAEAMTRAGTASGLGGYSQILPIQHKGAQLVIENA